MTGPSEKIILVIGATGKQGNAVARQLAQRGFHVRALTRNPNATSAQGLRQLGVEIVEGNLNNPSSLAPALKNAYGLFAMQDFWSAGYNGEIRQGKLLADAAKAARIKHFVYSSVASANKDTGIPHFDSKWQIEKYITSLQLPATILRPVFFMDNWHMPELRAMISQGTLAQPLSPDTRLQQIAVQDIGVFAANAFEQPEQWIERDLDLVGDELTMKETADVFSRVLNRDVNYYQTPWPDFEQAVGREMTLMYQWFESVGYDADLHACQREHPDLATLETFLRQHGWEQAAAA